MIDALAEHLHEFGRQDLSVTNVVRLAHTARNSFYELFGLIEECIAYAGEVALARYFAPLERLDGDSTWMVRIHRGVAGFYGAALAFASILALRKNWGGAIPLVWVANIWGFVDLTLSRTAASPAGDDAFAGSANHCVDKIVGEKNSPGSQRHRCARWCWDRPLSS